MLAGRLLSADFLCIFFPIGSVNIKALYVVFAPEAPEHALNAFALQPLWQFLRPAKLTGCSLERNHARPREITTL